MPTARSVGCLATVANNLFYSGASYYNPPSPALVARAVEMIVGDAVAPTTPAPARTAEPTFEPSGVPTDTDTTAPTTAPTTVATPSPTTASPSTATPR